MEIFEIFTLNFMQRAFISACLLSVLFGLFGTFIVPKRLSFMADGMSHASLLGIAIGIFVGVYPLIVAIAVASLFGFMLARVTDHGRITQDGLIGIFLAGGMSGAILLMSFVPGYKPELFSYLFGDLLTIRSGEVYGLVALSVVILCLFRILWRSLVMTTIHTELSHVIQLPVTQSKYFLFIGTSITLIAGVKLLGIILVSAVLIIPTLAAIQLGRSFFSTILLTQLIGVVATFCGIIFSYILDTPPGPSIAMLLVVIFVATSLLRGIKGSKTNHGNS